MQKIDLKDMTSQDICKTLFESTDQNTKMAIMSAGNKGASIPEQIHIGINAAVAALNAVATLIGMKPGFKSPEEVASGNNRVTRLVAALVAARSVTDECDDSFNVAIGPETFLLAMEAAHRVTGVIPDGWLHPHMVEAARTSGMKNNRQKGFWDPTLAEMPMPSHLN